MIQKVYTQQQECFDTGEKIINRIVCIHKDCARPTVRGKEVKSVEFRAKVNKIQIDRISFIEHINFNVFHKGNCFVQTIEKA